MTPLDKALQRLAQLQREMDEIRRFIELYHEFDDGERSRGEAISSNTQLKGNDTESQNNQSVENSPARSRKARSDGPRPKEIAGLMERVIRERGGPMSRGEIVDALERRDVEIPAQDKARYIGTLAWRNKGTFVNIEGRGYWLRDAGVPLLSGEPIDAPEYRALLEESGEDGLFD